MTKTSAMAVSTKSGLRSVTIGGLSPVAGREARPVLENPAASAEATSAAAMKVRTRCFIVVPFLRLPGGAGGELVEGQRGDRGRPPAGLRAHRGQHGLQRRPGLRGRKLVAGPEGSGCEPGGRQLHEREGLRRR